MSRMGIRNCELRVSYSLLFEVEIDDLLERIAFINNFVCDWIHVFKEFVISFLDAPNELREQLFIEELIVCHEFKY